MAQTKRKRRTKHRGNAAGQVETRGRTGRRPTDEELRGRSGGSARERRRIKPPSWNSAFLKSALMAALLFVFTRIGLFGDSVPLEQSFVLCAFAILLYTPLAYVTDRWVYNRDQRRRQQQKSG
jgi:hypothetical protein